MSAAVQELDFSVDWTSIHVGAWNKVLHLLVPRNKVLEIGSFEGRSSCWFLQNFLHPKGSLYCVDTWGGSAELLKITTEAAYVKFLRNIELAKGKFQTVEVLKKSSAMALTELIAGGHAETFDVIYVDGSHEADDTLTDACLSWRLLRPGGTIIFDDYMWGLQAGVEHRPKAAIDAFALCFNHKLTTMYIGDQYAIRKNRN